MAESTQSNAAGGRFRTPLPDETLAEYTIALEAFREREKIEEGDADLDGLSRVLVSLDNSAPVHDNPAHERTANEKSESPIPGRSPLPPDVAIPKWVQHFAHGKQQW